VEGPEVGWCSSRDGTFALIPGRDRTSAAAVQLVTTDIASAVAVAEGFGVSVENAVAWRRRFDADGWRADEAKTGPKARTS